MLALRDCLTVSVLPAYTRNVVIHLQHNAKSAVIAVGAMDVLVWGPVD